MRPPGERRAAATDHELPGDARQNVAGKAIPCYGISQVHGFDSGRPDVAQLDGVAQKLI